MLPVTPRPSKQISLFNQGFFKPRSKKTSNTLSVVTFNKTAQQSLSHITQVTSYRPATRCVSQHISGLALMRCQVGFGRAAPRLLGQDLFHEKLGHNRVNSLSRRKDQRGQAGLAKSGPGATALQHGKYSGRGLKMRKAREAFLDPIKPALLIRFSKNWRGL